MLNTEIIGQKRLKSNITVYRSVFVQLLFLFAVKKKEKYDGIGMKSLYNRIFIFVLHES